MRTGLHSQRTLILACLAGLVAVPLSAQRTEADIAARLKSKTLYLRGMWADDDLRFGPDGNLDRPFKPLPFTEAGFEMTKVKLRDTGLRIEGRRMALEFDHRGGMKRLPLEAGAYKGYMSITVQGAPGSDFTNALNAIFAADLADLTPALPSYWQVYARKNFLPQGGEPPEKPVAPEPVQAVVNEKKGAAPADAQKAMHVGGSVQPPKALKTMDPGFTAVARALKYSGMVQVYLWVTEDGSVSHLRINKPAGLGLDEVALAAVQQYKFAPATQNGKPVKVELYIDVNFQIF